MTMRHVVAGTLTALLTHRSYTALAQSQSPSPPLGSCRMTASCNVSPLFCNCENASSKASLFLFFLKFVVISISLYLYGLQRTRRGLYEFHLCELNLYFQLIHLAGASNQNEIVVRQASELSQLLSRSKMIKMECGVVDRNRIWLSAPAFGVSHHQLRAVSGHTPRSLKLLVIRLSPGRLRRFLCQRAVLPPEREVNGESDHQPDKEAHPCLHRQRHHQHQARHNRQARQVRRSRYAESAWPLRLLAAQHDHPGGNYDESEQRPDIRQIREPIDIENAGRYAHHQSRDPRADVRRLMLRVYLRKHFRQQSIARHGEPDARLSVLEH